MAKRPGSIWIETDGTLHYVDASGSEWRHAGRDVAACAGRAGSFWLEGNDLWYVVNGRKYWVVCNLAGAPGGRVGSIWIEGTRIHSITNNNGMEGTSHDDWTNMWGDHTDSGAHQNWSNHTNTAHDDWSDNHDDHSDWDDSWNDEFTP